MSFEFRQLAISGVVLIAPQVSRDGRGRFLETYKHSDFARAGITEHFVQDNFSASTQGVLRGLHYQKPPKAQGKLIRCMKGAILDVAVDIRKGSPTYGKWVMEELTEENNTMVYIPPGFAHGFLAMSDTAEVLYKCTDEYAPDLERGVIWNDPDLGIPWPVREPLLSVKDAVLPVLREADDDFRYGS
jgi:dTDP-4-dehydrorhamnose 3,5-epimerase